MIIREIQYANSTSYNVVYLARVRALNLLKYAANKSVCVLTGNDSLRTQMPLGYESIMYVTNSFLR